MKERQLADGMGGGGGGGAKPYDNEKAWSSIKHSIFSGIDKNGTRRKAGEPGGKRNANALLAMAPSPTPSTTLKKFRAM